MSNEPIDHRIDPETFTPRPLKSDEMLRPKPLDKLDPPYHHPVDDIGKMAAKRLHDHEMRQTAAVNVVQLVRMQVGRGGEFTGIEAKAVFDIAEMLHTIAGEG